MEHVKTCETDREIIQNARQLLNEYKQTKAEPSSNTRGLGDDSDLKIQNLENALSFVVQNLEEYDSITKSVIQETEASLSTMTSVRNEIHEMDKIKKERHARDISNKRSRGAISEHEERALDRAFREEEIQRWNKTELEVRKQVEKDRTREREVLEKKAKLAR